MKKVISFLLVILVSIASASASDKIDRYGVLPKIQQMTVSPSGEKVAFRSVSGSEDIVYVVNIKTGEVLTNVNVAAVRPRDVSFIDNESLLLKVSSLSRVPGFSGELDLSLAMTYNIKKNKYTQLLVPGKDNVYAGQTNLDNVVGVSDDGEWVFIPAYSGEPSFIGGQQLMPPMSLFKTKISGNGRARIHKQGQGQARDYFVANNGDVLAREVFEEDEQQHALFSVKGNKSVKIYSETTPYITKSFIGVSLDEKSLFMRDANNSKSRWALYTVALKDGKVEGPLFDRKDADIVSYISDKQRKVLGVQYSGFTPSYRFFEEDLNNRVQAILTKYAKHSVFIEEISPNTEHIIVRVEGNQYAGEYYLFSKGKDTVFVAKARPEIPTEDIHPIVPLSYAARDGLTIPTLVTLPRSKSDNLTNLPAIIMPHGGPASSDSVRFDFLAQALAEQGYLVIQPQFRGSVGFGLKHQAAGYGEWGRKALHDLDDAIGFFVEQNLIDPKRVCIVGASYGGYSALAAGAFSSDLYKCVVSINGIGNLPDMLARTRDESGRKSTALAYWEAQIMGFGEKDDSVAKQRSPQLAAANFTAPVLLIHSQKDETVHPRQSITMYRALKDAGKKVERLELADEDHYLSKGATRLQAIQAIVDFVNKNN